MKTTSTLSMKSMIIFFILSLVLTTSHTSFAWGGRGHQSICESAAFLVKNKNLKAFLTERPHTLGHLCNIPDTQWRGLPSELKKLGDPTHFVDPEVLGLTIKDIPLDYNLIIKKYSGQENQDNPKSIIQSIPSEFGSNWWRADQFFRLALVAATEAQKSKAPANKSEEQDDSLPFNKSIFEMLTYMSVMGHFVGDNAMPLHNTADYDGYASGNGGLHKYYEEDCVNEYGPDLSSLVTQKAQKLKNKTFLNPSTTIEKMKALSILSAAEIKDLIKLDPIESKSELTVVNGKSVRSAAKRKSAEIGQKKYDKLIMEQMARASLLLAHLWDQIYINSKEPDLSKYKNYRYPHTVNFVAPDYIDTKN